MISKIYWINEPEIGDKLLGIMPRPRGNDWLKDEIRGFQTRGISCIVSLLEFDEINELGLEKEKSFCEENGIEYINFPIKDVSIPKEESGFIKLINDLIIRLEKRKKVVIHCRMGIGRSSILAAGILIKKGIITNLFEKITKYRTLKTPDTEEQKFWILNLAHKLVTG